MSATHCGVPKVSVIVPMYKVERFLPRCLDSLLGQTLHDIEILAIDDGSPDRCGEIAEEYARVDPRVRVFHTPNGGLGTARNLGVQASSGEYLSFVDSDDWVAESFLENLYGRAVQDNADIVFGGFETWTDGQCIHRDPHPTAGLTLRGENSIEGCRKLLYGRLPRDRETSPYPVSVCSGVYSRRVVVEANLRFMDVYSEDTFFNLDAYRLASCIAHISECGYRYRKDSQSSLTTDLSERTASRYSDFFELLYEFACREKSPDECLRRAERKGADYARAYVTLASASEHSWTAKVRYVSMLKETLGFNRLCGSNVRVWLPANQAMFHWLLTRGDGRMALALCRAKAIAMRKI